MPSTTKTKPKSTTAPRNPAGPRSRVRPRKRNGGRPSGMVPLSERCARHQAGKAAKKMRRQLKGNYKTLRHLVLDLIPKEEVDALARECGYYVRKPKAIGAFEFVICCALAAVVEGERGFAGVWRLLGAAAGIEVGTAR